MSDAIEALATALGALSGWKRSRFAPGLFGKDTNNLLHKSFAVGAPETLPDGRESRQRTTEGMWSGTAIEVEWAYRLRGDAQVEDYGAAADAERELVAAVHGVTNQAALVESLRRRTVAEGWVLGVARFRLPHRYALTPPA